MIDITRGLPKWEGLFYLNHLLISLKTPNGVEGKK
jgi:hypothetical protein